MYLLKQALRLECTCVALKCCLDRQVNRFWNGAEVLSIRLSRSVWMKASSVKELQIFCAFVPKIKRRLGVGWRWMRGGISKEFNHHSNFNNIYFAAHIWKEMSFKGEVMLQLSLIFDIFHTSETWMLLYTLKRDVLMCAIPHVQCKFFIASTQEQCGNTIKHLFIYFFHWPQRKYILFLLVWA